MDPKPMRRPKVTGSPVRTRQRPRRLPSWPGAVRPSRPIAATAIPTDETRTAKHAPAPASRFNGSGAQLHPTALTGSAEAQAPAARMLPRPIGPSCSVSAAARSAVSCTRRTSTHHPSANTRLHPSAAAFVSSCPLIERLTYRALSCVSGTRGPERYTPHDRIPHRAFQAGPGFRSRSRATELMQ
jgi:hypothetical protein